MRPEWIVDSLRENRLLDYSKYLLHTNKNRTQPQINFKSKEKEEDPRTEAAGDDKDERSAEDLMMLSLSNLNKKLHVSDLQNVKPVVA